MAKKIISKDVYIEEVILLNDVTTATESDGIDSEVYNTKSFYVIVSGNTGAVTVNLEVSTDNTNWINLKSKTYTAENTSDTFSYSSHFSYVRATTTTQSNSTAKVTFTGRS